MGDHTLIAAQEKKKGKQNPNHQVKSTILRKELQQ